MTDARFYATLNDDRCAVVIDSEHPVPEVEAFPGKGGIREARRHARVLNEAEGDQ